MMHTYATQKHTYKCSAFKRETIRCKPMFVFLLFSFGHKRTQVFCVQWLLKRIKYSNITKYRNEVNYISILEYFPI